MYNSPMIRDSEFNEAAIAKFILTDSVERNQYLNTFIGALNSVNQNTYISVDANWGAGKTVFMKQLEYLNYCPLDAFNAPSLDHATVSDFQDKYIVFYYNAWENDYHDDPLQSLLFSLIDRFYTDEKRKDRVNSLTKTAVKSIATGAVKALSKGIVDIDKISSAETVDDLTGNIRGVNERKQAVSDIINKILPDGKKLLFIIDELDRCNPEFAVRLMEIAKHYYNDNDIVFVLSTNNRQLVHTVQKYYGNNFDGYGYLDKLFDLILELPPVNIERYYTTQLKTPRNSEWVNLIPIGIAQHLNMTMREINRYSSLYRFVSDRLRSSPRWYSTSTVPLLTSFVFVPLALALKVRDIKLYDKFVKGDGESIIRDLYKSKPVFQRINAQGATHEESESTNIAVEAYKSMISGDNPQNGTRADYEVKEAGDFFRSILPLIASVGEIDKSESDSQEE
jgi:hypothetical protein